MRLQFITKWKSAFDISVKLAYINKYTIKKDTDQLVEWKDVDY